MRRRKEGWKEGKVFQKFGSLWELESVPRGIDEFCKRFYLFRSPCDDRRLSKRTMECVVYENYQEFEL